MNKLLVIIASIFLIGCVTRTEFVVGTDGQGNEILKEKSDIDYVKAANDRINLAIRYIEMKQMTDAKINLEKAEQYNPGKENLYLAWGYYYTDLPTFPSFLASSIFFYINSSIISSSSHIKLTTQIY